MQKFIVIESDSYGSTLEYFTAQNEATLLRQFASIGEYLDIQGSLEKIADDDRYCKKFEEMVKKNTIYYNLKLDIVSEKKYNGAPKDESEGEEDFEQLILDLSGLKNCDIVDSLSDEEIRFIHKLRNSPGKYFQEGEPGKEWYGLKIKKWEEPQWIDLSQPVNKKAKH